MESYEEVIIKRINSNAGLPKENRQSIKDMLYFMQSRGAKPNTLRKHIYCFEKFIYAIGKTPISKSTKRDVERALAEIEGLELAEETKRNIKVVVKQFYKHFYGDDDYFPEPVRWIKTTAKKSNNKLPSDLLTEDDILRLLDSAKNERDRAIISLLFETGIRASELLGMRKQDANLLSDPCFIIINESKTIPRRIAITYSAGYIGAYMRTIKNVKDSDYLWRDIDRDKRLEYNSFRMMIQIVSSRAKLEKHIYAHLFRHSAASRYASRISEPVLKAIMGWSPSSTMTSKYVHLSGRTIDTELLKANGVQIKVEKEETKLKSKECSKCKFLNLANDIYCNRCGKLLEPDKVVLDEESKYYVRELMLEIMKDPDYLNKLKEMKARIKG